MAMSQCTGQAQVAAWLSRQIQNRRVSHAYLLAGQHPLPLKEMGRAFAKALHCQQPIEGDSCDRCLNCLRFEHGNDPEYLEVSPDGAFIKAEQIVQIQAFLTKRREEGIPRIYLIEEAERISPQAVHRLLKTLEEPVGHTVAILLSTQPSRLLSTIRSRCQLVRLSPTPPAEIAEVLMDEGVEAQKAHVAAYLTENLEEAREVARWEGFEELQNGMVQWMQLLPGRPVEASMLLADWFKKEDKEFTRWFVDLALMWLRDLLVLHAGLPALIFGGKQEILQQQLSIWTKEQILDAASRLTGIRRKMELNVGLQLALEGMVFEMNGGETGAGTSRGRPV